MKKLFRFAVSAALCLTFSLNCVLSAAASGISDIDINPAGRSAISGLADKQITAKLGNTYEDRAQRLYGGDTSEVSDSDLAAFLEKYAKLKTGSSNADYYFKSLDVDITANADNSFDIIETYDVYFKKPAHGITHPYPSSDSAWQYQVKNISVSGAPWEFSETDDRTIKIGSPNKKVSGDQRYVVSYSLVYSEDQYPDYDRIYLNIVGDKLESVALDLTARLHLPEGVEPEADMIYSGSVDSVDNSLNVQKIYCNGVYYLYTQNLEAYNCVTLDVKLPDGSLSENTLIQPPYITVNKLDVDIQCDKYGVFNVSETYKCLVNNKNARFIRMPDRSFADSNVDYIVSDFSCTINGEKLDCSNNTVDIWRKYSAGNQFTCLISYKVETEVRNFIVAPKLKYNIVDGDSIFLTSKTLYKSIAVDMHFDDDMDRSGISVMPSNGSKSLLISDSSAAPYGFKLKESRDGFTLTSNGTIPVDNSIILELSAADDIFVRQQQAADMLLPISAAALLIITIISVSSRKKKEKNIVPTVEFYPPDGLNPAEIGYIFNGSSGYSNLNALIYYWASHGHLAIEVTGETNDKTYLTLHKLTDLDSAHSNYEQVLFDKIWNIGDGISVTENQITLKLFSEAESASNNNMVPFLKDDELIDSHSKKRSERILILLPVVFTLITLFFALIYRFIDTSLIIGAIVSFLFLITAAGLLNSRSDIRQLGYRGLGNRGRHLGISMFGFNCMTFLLYVEILICSVPINPLGWSFPEPIASRINSTIFLSIPLVSLFEIICLVFVLKKGNKKAYRGSQNNSANVALLLFSVLIAICNIFSVILRIGGAVSITSYIVSLVLIFMAMLIPGRLHHISDYGTNILGRCLGFREFLKTAEKDKLEMLLEENPGYYYELLPYAQALGVTELWTDRFSGLLHTVPTWYYGHVPMTPGGVSRSMTARMIDMGKMISYAQSSVNSRFGSGSFLSGGFGSGGAGGGGGGAGGGSW